MKFSILYLFFKYEYELWEKNHIVDIFIYSWIVNKHDYMLLYILLYFQQSLCFK